jgi:hypothetical protein
LAEHVILGGDFNHFEEEEGIRGQAGERRMHKREATTWHHLTLQYGLLDAWNLDSFRRMSKKEYTFDNGRKGQGSAISRIDKFLVSQELESRGGRIEFAPSIRKISDHSPLKLTVWGRTLAPPRTVTFFDITMLKEDESRGARGPPRGLRRHPTSTKPRRGLARMARGSHRKGVQLQWQASEGEENGRRGLEPEASNTKSDWRKFGYKKTPKMKQSGTSSQWRKDT